MLLLGKSYICEIEVGILLGGGILAELSLEMEDRVLHGSCFVLLFCSIRDKSLFLYLRNLFRP